jgi:DNA-binding CsgD family transcriptional regulator/tetratricopeptide (TPR) repeat protein
MRKAEKMLKKYPYNRYKGDILTTLAFMKLLLGERQQAIEYFQQAEQHFQEQGYVPARIYTAGAQIYIETGDFKKGCQYLFTAEELCVQEFEQIQAKHLQQEVDIKANKLLQIQICSLTVACFMSIEDFYIAELYIQLGLQLCNEEEYTPQRAHLFGQWSNLLIMKKEFDRVEKVAEEALTLYYKTKIPMIGINSYLARSLATMHKGEIEQSIMYAQQACTIADAQRDKTLRLHPYFFLSEALLKYPQRIQSARTVMDKLLDILGNSKGGIWLQSRRLLAHLAELEGNTALQLQSMKEFIEASEQSKVRSNVLRSTMHSQKALQKRSFLQDKLHSLPDQFTHTITREAESTSSIRLFDALQTTEYIAAIRGSINELYEKIDTLKQREIKAKLTSIQRILHDNLSEAALLHDLEKEILSPQKDFTFVLSKQFPQLSSTEQRICALLRLHLNTHQIASVMSISPQTVFTHRKHIRQKLNIPKSVELHTFLLALQDDVTDDKL